MPRPRPRPGNDRASYLLAPPGGGEGNTSKKEIKKRTPHYSRRPRVSKEEMSDLLASMRDIFKVHFREAMGEKAYAYISDGLRYHSKWRKSFTVKQANLFSEQVRLARGSIRRKFPKANISKIKLKPEYVDPKAVTQEDLDALE